MSAAGTGRGRRADRSYDVSNFCRPAASATPPDQADGEDRLGRGALPRDCLITDISTGGVRLHVEGFDVPNDFVLVLLGDDLAKECNYQVVWRLGPEIGARFVGLVRRSATAGQG